MSKTPRLALTQLEARDVPATLVWEGDLGANWGAGTPNVDTNWHVQNANTQAKPADGDTLIFDDTGGTRVTTNDIAGLSVLVARFDVQTLNAQPYTVTGGSEPLTLTGGVIVEFSNDGGADHVVFAPLVLDSTCTIGSVGARGLVVGDIDLNGRKLFIRSDTADLRFGGVISGDGEIVLTEQASGNSVTFGGNNTFNGFVTVDTALRLVADHENALGNALNTVFVEPDGVLTLRYSTDVNLGLSGDGFDGAGALQIDPVFTTVSVYGDVGLYADAEIGVPLGKSVTIFAAVVGEHALTKSGAGRVVFFVPGSTFGGPTNPLTVEGGEVYVAAADALPNDILVSLTTPATTLSLNGYSDAIGRVSGSGLIDLGAGTLALNGGGQEVFSGVITGTGGLYLAGGELRLTGAAANTHTGSTIVGGGVLRLDKPAGVNAFGGRLFVVDVSGVVLWLAADQIPDDAVVTNAVGLLDLAGFAETIGNLTGADAAEVRLGAGVLTLSAGEGTFNGVISGTGGLIVTGGDHTLGGPEANTFTGQASVVGGTLRLNKTAGVKAVGGNIGAGDGVGTDSIVLLAADQIRDTAQVLLGGGGVFDLNGFGETVAMVSGPGGRIDLGAGQLVILGPGAGTFAGTIVGTGGVVLIDGEWRLQGNSPNTFTGNTVVSGGVLRLDKSVGVDAFGGDLLLAGGGVARLLKADQIPDDQPVVNTGGVFDLNGFDEAIRSLSGGIDSQILLGAGDLTLTDGVGNYQGVISGTGGLIVSGGEHVLGGTAANTFSGTTLVFGGALLLNKTAGVDAVGGDILTGVGSTIRLLAPDQIPDAATVGLGNDCVLDLNGFDEAVARLTGLAGGTVDLGAGTLTLTGPVGDTFVGVITGGGGLTITGGAHTLGGPAANTFTGTTRVTGGGLYLAKDDGVAAVSGTVVLAGGGLYLQANEQLPDDAVVTLEPGGDFNLADRTETIAALGGTGGTADFDGTLTVGGAQSATFGGALAGGGVFTRTGTGTTTFTGDSPAFTGNAVVTSGELVVNGNVPNAAFAAGGGRLTGNGTVGTLTGTGGVTSPGESAGRLTADAATFGAGTTFEVELNGPVAGTDYDQLAVAGPVSLGGTLSILPGFVPALGDAFTLIDNDAADAVAGTFDGMPEGAVVKIAGFDYRITYTGGDGNDVVLTRVPLATGGTQLTAAGAGVGGAPRVQVFNADGTLRFDFFAFEDSFRGGVEVAVGDVNGDGTDDVVVAAGPGGAPRVRAFSGTDNTILMDFFAFDMTLRGGASVAVGDLNGDGFADVVVGAGVGGGPHVRAISGKDSSPLLDFFAYEPTFTGGVTVAAGDLDGDGVADIVTTPGSGGGPAVRAFSGTTGSQVLAFAAFAAFDPSLRLGFEVTTADVTGDGLDEIVVVPGPGGGPDVRAFDAKTGTQVKAFLPFDAAFRGGVRLAGTGVGATGEDNLLFGPGPGVRGRLKLIDGGTGETLRDADLFDAGFVGGVFVG